MRFYCVYFDTLNAGNVQSLDCLMQVSMLHEMFRIAQKRPTLMGPFSAESTKPFGVETMPACYLEKRGISKR